MTTSQNGIGSTFASPAASMIVVANGQQPGIFEDPTGGLLAEIRGRLPDVHVSAVSDRAASGLDAALAAAAFVGAPFAVVVQLRGSRQIDVLARCLGRQLDVVSCEAPPKVDVILAAYCAASVERTPSLEVAS